MATIQRINIIGSREGSRNRRRLKANKTGKKFRVGIKSNISTNRNILISGVDRCIHLNAMKKTFFFSSRRRHTRSKRDWSSDVCSSDLVADLLLRMHQEVGDVAAELAPLRRDQNLDVQQLEQGGLEQASLGAEVAQQDGRGDEIGRAACRERG